MDDWMVSGTLLESGVLLGLALRHLSRISDHDWLFT